MSKKQLAYPRGLVHLNHSGGWSLAWRNHADSGNHWDSAMYDAPHFTQDQLPDAHCEATRRVDRMWVALGRGQS